MQGDFDSSFNSDFSQIDVSQPETNVDSKLPIPEIGPQMAHQVDFPR